MVSCSLSVAVVAAVALFADGGDEFIGVDLEKEVLIRSSFGGLKIQLRVSRATWFI